MEGGLKSEKFNGHKMEIAHHDPTEIVEAEPLSWKFWKKRRYVVVLLAFLGFFNVYSLRVNLSVAIVAMTENRTVIDDAGNVSYEQDFPWDSKQKGLILSSFFYGYITTQFIGGFIGAKIGGNIVFGLGIGTTALLTLLTPLAAKHSLEMFLAVRIIEGVFEGVTFPCIHAVWARWAPPLERSRMASIAFAGNYAGTVVAMPSSGLLASAYGWESVFYVFGTIGLIWFIVWMLMVRSGPDRDRYCSDDEREYIQKKIGYTGSMTIKHPWRAIFTSKPFYAIVASHFSENWGFYTLLTQLPTFLKDTLNFNLDKTGFISAVPYLAMGILLGVSGYLADWLQIKKILTTSQVRRYFNCGAFLAQTTFMILTAYLLDPTWSVVCITTAVGLGAFAWSGFAVNHLDIAPQHASVLMGIGNTFATIPGIVSPLLTGYLVTNQTAEEWKVVFFISAGVYLIGCLIYWFWASGELQEWAKLPEQKAIEAEQKQGALMTNATGREGYVNAAVDLKDQ
ncbi:sialin [Anastrepha obliqua]|uniref:sialin n=1 Tax=Anastrepha obliqua TaxID=95512 RepID=UPI00240A9B97|nr:sialin [Anastrepha obliqua]XP_054734153.1 sialin [Anastrepha obliqua]XP_054734154.1 sialin [Anastrepha obliqua]XP_054734155.1 sialin [Anastrepha obliqua]XP_054734156.1 sialin [Anastrepha obliqua]XP_054734157.1 sialin [Anastrepha obliqua]